MRDWDRWIPMYLLAYKKISKHETIGVTELYFARDLKLSLNLLWGYPPKSRNRDSTRNYFISKLRKKLEEVHTEARRQEERN